MKSLTFYYIGVFVADWSKVPDWKFRSKVVVSIRSYTSHFSTPDCEEIKKTQEGNSNLQCP